MMKQETGDDAIKGKVVGQENQSFVGLAIEVADAPQFVGIIFLSVETLNHNG